MITCPACGKDNDDAAVLCRRCRGPLRDEPLDEAPLEHEHQGAPKAQPEVPAHHEPAAVHHEAAAHHETGAHAERHRSPADDLPGSDSLGEVCRRCESYNEPGTRRCTTCGFVLIADAPGQPHSPRDELPLDKTPTQAFAPPHHEGDHLSGDTPRDGSPSVADELSALALSPEEAAEAGLSTANGAHPSGRGADVDFLYKTPPQAFEPPIHEAPSVVSKGKIAVAEAAGVAVGVAAAAGAAVVGAVRRSPPSEPPANALRAESTPAPRAGATPRLEPEQKPCSSCAALNPPAAKFCFDCGTPFARKAPKAPVRAAPPAPVKVELPPEPARFEPPRTPMRIEPIRPIKSVVDETAPSIQVGADLFPLESTMETSAVSADPLPDPDLPALLDEPVPDVAHEHDAPHEEAHHDEAAPAVEAWAGAALLGETSPGHLTAPAQPAFAEPDAEPDLLAEEVAEPAPPFQASVILERGAAAGTAIMLGRMENTVGSTGAAIEIADDPFVAPHAATVVFADDRLVLRDEGTANGVYVRIHETAGLEVGDLFIAGERMMRYDGACELPQTHEGEVPFLGAPRPQGTAVRIVEVLAGGRTGRTCHRSGPTIALGRTGCDMNFPADSLLGGRHAEIRIGEDGSATIADLGQGPAGVFLRVRAQAVHELNPGDMVRVGDQEFRVEVG